MPWPPGDPRDHQRRTHGGEGAAGDTGHREQPGHPVRVQHGELEGGVHADRPAGHGTRVDPRIIQDRQRVLEERVDADPRVVV